MEIPSIPILKPGMQVEDLLTVVLIHYIRAIASGLQKSLYSEKFGYFFVIAAS